MQSGDSRVSCSPLQNHLYGSVRVLTPSIHRRILTKADTMQQCKYILLAAAAVRQARTRTRTCTRRDCASAHGAHSRAHGNAPLHSRCVHICGGQLAVPDPAKHLVYERLMGLVTRGPLVVVLPPRQTADDWDVETFSAVPTAELWCEERDRQWTVKESVPEPVLEVVPSFFFFFLVGKGGNASCTVTPKRHVWDSIMARQWAQRPFGRYAMCPTH